MSSVVTRKYIYNGMGKLLDIVVLINKDNKVVNKNNQIITDYNTLYFHTNNLFEGTITTNNELYFNSNTMDGSYISNSKILWCSGRASHYNKNIRDYYLKCVWNTIDNKVYIHNNFNPEYLKIVTPLSYGEDQQYGENYLLPLESLLGKHDQYVYKVTSLFNGIGIITIKGNFYNISGTNVYKILSNVKDQLSYDNENYVILTNDNKLYHFNSNSRKISLYDIDNDDVAFYSTQMNQIEARLFGLVKNSDRKTLHVYNTMNKIHEFTYDYDIVNVHFQNVVGYVLLSDGTLYTYRKTFDDELDYYYLKLSSTSTFDITQYRGDVVHEDSIYLNLDIDYYSYEYKSASTNINYKYRFGLVQNVNSTGTSNVVNYVAN